MTRSCIAGGAQCLISGSVSSPSCTEADGLPCSGQLNQVVTTGVADTCTGTGTTTFVYSSTTLGGSRTIPVTVSMADGATTVDGSDGFLTVHATFDVFCIPLISWATSFQTTWSGTVTMASAS